MNFYDAKHEGPGPPLNLTISRSNEVIQIIHQNINSYKLPLYCMFRRDSCFACVWVYLEQQSLMKEPQGKRKRF